MARLFSRRLSLRAVSVVGAVLLVVLAGGEAWVRSSDSTIKGVLPWVVQTIQQWKRPSAPESAVRPVSGAQATATVDDRKIFDQLADLIMRQRCTTRAYETAANETGWSFVLAPSSTDAMQKIRDDKLALVEYRELMQSRIDVIRKFDASGKALIFGINAAERDKAEQQFSSAENMVIDSQSVELDARERELQSVDKMLDISLRAYSHSPDKSRAPTYTPAEVARLNSLLADVRVQDEAIKQLYDRTSYAISYADHQLNTLVTPAPGSPPRYWQCPKDIAVPHAAIAVNEPLVDSAVSRNVTKPAAPRSFDAVPVRAIGHETVNRQSGMLSASTQPCEPLVPSAADPNPEVNIVGTKMRGDYANDPLHTIYLSVVTDGCGPSTLSVEWKYGPSRLVNVTDLKIVSHGPTWSVFNLKNPNDWPLGAYHVDVKVNGAVLATQHFSIGVDGLSSSN
ncbi:hypothetical protein GCM10010872_40810 [Dyella flava]|nr:hypothetical protein GCM10010872_40810 [Dyella flava]